MPSDLPTLEYLRRVIAVAHNVVAAYLQDRGKIATILDLDIDPSGATLGWVRDLAMSKQPKELIDAR